MSRKYFYGYDDLEVIYEDLHQEMLRKRDKKKRNMLGKERRYKFSRRNHPHQNEAMAY
ncbi:hypothetical protein H0V99_02455 [Candidatus Saccharibacteria bacterium]|nr:hypothetical protein [Candidatus Saccharibacteria bacterium]